MAIGAINTGGLQSSVKRKRLRELDFDILALSETHLQRHLEKSQTGSL